MTKQTNNGAVAVFVKTPGLSPLKTRLAASIGQEAAEKFYLLSGRAIAAVIEKVEGLTPYWAVAEKEGLANEHWQNFDCVWQGEGDLGKKLHHVYQELLKKHDFVLFLGADSPQLEVRHLQEAIHGLEKDPFVLGEAGDGGFYLFGGSLKIEQKIWQSVPYSQSTTAESLKKELEKLGSVGKLAVLDDVDNFADLKSLCENWSTEQNTRLTEQEELYQWMRREEF